MILRVWSSLLSGGADGSLLRVCRGAGARVQRATHIGVVLAGSLAIASCRTTQPSSRNAQDANVASGTGAARATAPRPPDTARLEPIAPSPTLQQGARSNGPATRAATGLDLFRASVDSMVDDPIFRNAHWGILVVNPDKGDTLYAHNADKLFMPASNQKIVTGAVGLTQLGADFQWHTVFELRGTQKGSVFAGNVIVKGRGDPSWSDFMHGGNASLAFTPVAEALATRGITSIAGNIMAEGDAFSDEPYGFGWAYDDFDFGYSAPVDELFYNEGFFTVTVKAGRLAAKPLTVTSKPLLTYPKIVVRAVARARADSVGEDKTLRVRWDSTASAIVVTGTLPLGDSTRVELAYRHSNEAALAALREFLVAGGVKFVPARKTGTHARVDTLAVLVSPPLRDVLARLEKPSQNQLAEILYKTIALERTGFGRADSARAVVERQLAEWGILPEAIAVRDGSGLSRHDYIAPRTLVKILDTMRRTSSFDVFYAALPIAGVDGTIANRMRNTVAANNVRAKTGTVDKARSLSGYVTTADGQTLVFSLLCNNFSVPTRAVERVQDAIAVRLASMRINDVP